MPLFYVNLAVLTFMQSKIDEVLYMYMFQGAQIGAQGAHTGAQIPSDICRLIGRLWSKRCFL
jgi:hypothetical protein